MILSEVTQKAMKTRVEVMVMELETRKAKGLLSFKQLLT